MDNDMGGRVPSYHPRDLQPWQDRQGWWWLCVNGDPERIAAGLFGSKDKAEAYRQALVDGIERREREAAHV